MTSADAARLDKWLWQARFFKTRSLATKVCRAHKVRLDGTIQKKASAAVAPGVVLTFPQGDRIRVVRVVALATRRGPATEAALLYEDQTPPPPAKTATAKDDAARDRGAGRPTKAERRALDRLRDRG